MKKGYRNLGRTTILTKLTQPTRDSGRQDHLSKSNLHLSRRGEKYLEKSQLIGFVTYTPKYLNPSVAYLKGKNDGGIFLARELMGRRSLLLRLTL